MAELLRNAEPASNARRVEFGDRPLANVRTADEIKFIVHLFGGLGNQLFQYAAGRYYAQQHAARVVLAFRGHLKPSHGDPRPFSISHFAIAAPYREMTKTERLLQRMLTPARSGPARIAAALRATIGLQVVAEKADQRFRFLPQLAIHERTAAVNLIGYWQVHNIAESIADELRSEFCVKASPTGPNIAMLRRIQSSPNAVSLHIRRGDYLLSPDGHFALAMSYYSRAIERIKASIPDPTFFVFSDDVDFARNNVARDLAAVFVDNNDAFTAHEDLRLMSACRHHIIANSTFSWWGAWLNPRPDKLVLAPRTWMAANMPPEHDLIPPNWTAIDSDK